MDGRHRGRWSRRLRVESRRRARMYCLGFVLLFGAMGAGLVAEVFFGVKIGAAPMLLCVVLGALLLLLDAKLGGT